MLIAGIASLCLIFMIMVVFTRSLIASMVIVGSVVFSLGGSFGSLMSPSTAASIRAEDSGVVMAAIIRTLGGTGSVVTVVPATAALLGRWFWWPLNVRARPVPVLTSSR